MASESDSDSMQTDSDEGEEEDDSGDLSHLGAAATTVKLQTVKQQSFQVAERGSERLAQQILDSCQISNQQLVPTTGSQHVQESGDLHHRHSNRGVQQVNLIQVQQQFGDVDIFGTRNLTIGGTQNIGRPGPSQEGGNQITDQIHTRTLSKMESWTKGMVRTSALEKVMVKLKKGTKWLTIKGKPGEGKSTVAFMALEEMHKSGRQVFHVKSPKEFSEVTATCSQPVIMMDDIFGNLEFDQAKWLMWEDVLHDVLDVKEHRSHEKQSKEDVTVIVVGREYVLNTASCNMGRMADFFTQEEYVVSMSQTTERTIEEKLSIWKAISDNSGIVLEQYTIDKICCTNGPHGFPHVCRLFITIRKKQPKITAEEFFEKPLEFLNQTVLKFMHDKRKLILFKEMIKNDGKVSASEIEKLDSGFETIQTALDLVGTYLKKEDDYFLFDHPSIYDCVAYNICTLSLEFVIENCNLSFIHERLRLEPSRDTQPDTPNTESSLVVNIPRASVGYLAKRFASEISKQNLLQVLSHKAFTDEMFIQKVMSQLRLKVKKLIKLKDIKSREKFLSLLASNKFPQLLRYVNNHIERPLKRDEINTVLYGVCKYAASDVLTYLTQICDTLDINVRYGKKRQTPLMIAAETRDSQFVQDILSLNPDVNARDKDDTTAFHYMCWNDLVSVVRQMIDRGTDIHVKGRYGWLPLYYACKGNHVEVVRLLLDRGARMDDMAVWLGCKYGSVETVSVLFERGATVNMTRVGGTPLYNACLTGNLEVIKYLIDKGASVNFQEHSAFMSPLHAACRNNKPEAVRYLLEHGAVTDSRDCRGNTPLHTAAESGSKECVDMLLKAGIDVNVQNEDGNTPLHTAAESGSKECVDMLLKAGIDVNVQSKDGYTPLHTAAGRGSKKCVEMLLKAGSDVNVQSRDGYTPLHTAAGRGSKTCVEMLLKAGSDLNVQSKDGYTPLHKAAGRGSKECVDTLLKAGIDVNVQNESGQTPLHTAVYYKDVLGHVRLPSVHVCQTLIRQGADVNKQDTEGNTPLHLLCSVDSRTEMDKDWMTQPASSYEDVYRRLVTLLVDHGADVNIHNNRGKPALRGWCRGLVKKSCILQ